MQTTLTPVFLLCGWGELAIELELPGDFIGDNIRGKNCLFSIVNDLISNMLFTSRVSAGI